MDTDPEATCSLAYDAARKSATALLAYQELRPTTAGGHIAVVDVMRAQFPGVLCLAWIPWTGSAGAVVRPSTQIREATIRSLLLMTAAR